MAHIRREEHSRGKHFMWKLPMFSWCHYNNSFVFNSVRHQSMLEAVLWPKTSRANRDWKKRRRKTPTYLHFSVMLTRAGHILTTPSAEMNTLSPYSVSKSSILHCAHHDAGSALQITTAALNSPICCGPVPPSNTAANRFKSLDASYQTVSWIRVN